MHGRYVTDILKMCMKTFNAEKIIFDKLTGFCSAHCRGGGNTVSLACSQFLVLDCISFILAGKKDNYKVSDEIEFRPDPTMDCGVSWP